MKFRKKPVVVEAFIFGIHVEPKWFQDAIDTGTVTYYCVSTGPEDHPPDGLVIKTLEGDMRAGYGNEYIIRGINGEIYPCKPDIFEATYEPVEE